MNNIVIPQNETTAQHLRRELAKDGYTVLCCSHLEDSHIDFTRNFNIGGKTILFLCPYCSGLIVETILKEFQVKP